MLTADPLPLKALLGSALLHALLLLTLLPLSTAPSAAATRFVSSWATESVEVGIEPATPIAPAAARPAGEGARVEEPAPPRSATTQEAPSSAEVSERRPVPRATQSPRPARTASAASRSASAAARRGNEARSAHVESAPSAAASSSAQAPAGSLGAVGLPVGVQHFAKAFAWALPEGGHRDATWSELALGPAGKAIVEFTIGADGRVEKVEFDPDVSVPPALRRMIDHAVFLLRPRKFSLDARTMTEGVERISIEVSLSQRAASGDEDANPRDLAAEGYKAPVGERPGYAHFTLNSGRHMEAVLRQLPPR